MILPRISILLLGTLLALASTRLHAQTSKLQTESVTLYPGGVAYVQKRGRVTFERGKALLDENPPAIGNSLTVEVLGNAELKRKAILQDTVYRPRRAKSFFEILKANPGKEAIVTYFIGKEVEDVVGNIRPYNPGSDLIELRKADNSIVFVHKDQLKQVNVQGGKVSQTYYEAVKDTALLLELATPFLSANVVMGYYTKGIRWEPRYQLRELSDSTVRLTMKAIVHNTGETLRDIDLHLSLGIPAISEGITPEMRELYSRLTKPRPARPRLPDGQPGQVQEPQEPKPVRGFTVDKVTIEGGSAAEITLMETTLPAQMAQFVELPVQVDANSLNPSLPDNISYTVAQARMLKNTSDKPLLPGKVQILSKSGMPIGEDKLTGVPLDGQALIGGGISEGVVVKVKERIGKEERKAQKLSNGYYDFLKIDGMLTIGNLTDNPQIVKVVVPAPGKPLRYLGGNKDEADGKLGVNQMHTITYNITLEPKRTYKNNYSYGYYRPTP